MADDYATKADIQDLRDELHAVGDELRTEFRTELRGEIGSLRTELRGEIASVRDAVHVVGVMLEQMNAKADAFMESCSTKASKTEVEAADTALSERLSAVEDVVRHIAGERKS